MVGIFNRRGNGSIIMLIIFLVIFTSVATVMLDHGVIEMRTKRIEEAIEKATKAGVVAVQENSNLANGYFLIDETDAHDNFYDILTSNLNINRATLEAGENSIINGALVVKEFSVINATPTTYYSPTLNRSYEIDYPSVISVVSYEVNGVFTRKTYVISQLASSQLLSVYD